MSPQLATLLRLSDELESLLWRGLGDSPEADALRGRMNGPWRALTSAEMNAYGEYVLERRKARRKAGITA